MQPIPLAPPIRETLARLEPQIAGLPTEQLYVIDALGNVVAHRKGGARNVQHGAWLTRWMSTHPLDFVMVHNHPRGTAHSSRDVMNLFRRYAAESRVVTPQGTVYRVQPLVKMPNGPSDLYAYQAALDAAADDLPKAGRLDHLLELYARGIERVRLPSVIRYGKETIARANPRRTPQMCGCCAEGTDHG
mgnify:CR=1 FL=1